MSASHSNLQGYTVEGVVFCNPTTAGHVSPQCLNALAGQKITGLLPFSDYPETPIFVHQHVETVSRRGHDSAARRRNVECM